MDLARLGPEAAGATAELLEDGEPGVRALASEALGILGDASVSPVLERAIASDPDPQVRLYAARSLGQLGTIRPTRGGPQGPRRRRLLRRPDARRDGA